MNKDLISRVARYEGVSASFILKGLRSGTIAIPANNTKSLKKPCAIGKGLRTKINANIGTSPFNGTVKEELKKLDLCVKYQADTVMDLSTGSNLKQVRAAIIKSSSLPVGTVPIYEAAVWAQKNRMPFWKVTPDLMFDVIEEQAKEGVDFFTIHAGVTKKVLSMLKKHPRVAGIVSRGGALIADWMHKNGCENPFFTDFDRLLSISKKYNITLSLGDGLRPGSVCDATDSAQIGELRILGELAKRSLKAGVQAMIEGPGHVPIDQIEKNMALQKKLCHNVPFYVLGPLVTDVAAGYDHISSAIGAAMAGYYGADFLCYVTPSEHLSIPTIDDVREGLIAYRIAAHSADIAKGIKGAIDWDRKLSGFRRERKWPEQIKLSMDPEKARLLHNRFGAKKDGVCTMCGEYCPLKISEKI